MITENTIDIERYRQEILAALDHPDSVYDLDAMLCEIAGKIIAERNGYYLSLCIDILVGSTIEHQTTTVRRRKAVEKILRKAVK